MHVCRHGRERERERERDRERKRNKIQRAGRYQTVCYALKASSEGKVEGDVIALIALWN